jgi:hypothetical protein
VALGSAELRKVRCLWHPPIFAPGTDMSRSEAAGISALYSEIHAIPGVIWGIRFEKG